MSRGKVLAICQSGGEFFTNKDGTLNYVGGEAHAMDVERHLALNDLKSEIANMFGYRVDSFSIKYFLPGNKRTLITVSNDKDLQRMVDFNVNSTTTEVYALQKIGNRSKSIVADSDAPTGPSAGTIVTADHVKRLKTCTGWENLITGVGQIFESPMEMRDVVHKYAVACSFIYKYLKNDSHRVTVACAAGNCPWRIHASGRAPDQPLKIKKMNDRHTCGSESSRDTHRLASQRWVASVIKDRLREVPDYKPREIAKDLHEEYGLCLNYTRAWRGKYMAKKELHNSDEEACSQLTWFCQRILETNPGSIVELEASEDSRFVGLFVSFHACLSGFEACRPLLFLESIPLKVTKRWKLLAATAVDSENDSFPHAFAVVESVSSGENWKWFLMHLKSSLSTSKTSRTMTFVAGRESGLQESLSEVFENSFHGFNVRDLLEEFKSRMDDTWSLELSDAMVDQLMGAVDACRPDEFDVFIESIRDESEELGTWVVESKPFFWSNAFFKGLRYGQYESRAFETFNRWVSGRQEPSVVQIVDMIRCGAMEMIYTRHESASTWAEVLAPSAHRRVQENSIEASRDVVGVAACSTGGGGGVFELRDSSGSNVIDLGTWECTCRRWQVDGLPCKHVLAVLDRTDACVYDYCSKYFSSDSYRYTYSLSINPIPNSPGKLLSDVGVNSSLYPLRTRRMVGRPKLKPEYPRITCKRTTRCSRCKEYGHNKQTCKVLLALT